MNDRLSGNDSKKMLDLFFELEKADFGGMRDADLVRTQQEVEDFLQVNASDWVALESLVSAGLMVRSMLFDMFNPDVHHTKRKSITVLLCPCGRGWQAADSDGKFLVSLKCHG